MVVRDLDRLLRWQDSGGTWRVLTRRSDSSTGSSSLTIALCRCDGGEEVDRFASADSALIAHIGERESSEDAG